MSLCLPSLICKSSEIMCVSSCAYIGTSSWIKKRSARWKIKTFSKSSQPTGHDLVFLHSMVGRIHSFNLYNILCPIVTYKCIIYYLFKKFTLLYSLRRIQGSVHYLKIIILKAKNSTFLFKSYILFGL